MVERIFEAEEIKPGGNKWRMTRVISWQKMCEKSREWEIQKNNDWIEQLHTQHKDNVLSHHNDNRCKQDPVLNITQ